MKKCWRIIILGIICSALFLIDLCVDEVIITPFAFLHSQEDAFIMFNIRLPRVTTAFLVGGIMGMCGTVMQTITRNVLASPYIIGISAGAGFGAALAAFGFGIFTALGIRFSAFLGAIIASLPVFLYIRRQTSQDFTLVLMGTAISSLCNAGIAITQYFATPDQVYQYILGYGRFAKKRLEQYFTFRYCRHCWMHHFSFFKQRFRYTKYGKNHCTIAWYIYRENHVFILSCCMRSNGHFCINCRYYRFYRSCVSAYITIFFGRKNQTCSFRQRIDCFKLTYTG